MAHYAELDNNNIVLRVIVVRTEDTLDENGNESETVANDFLHANGITGRFIRTSYNSRGNVHYIANSNEPSGQIAFRGNYAGMGYIYDSMNDVFIPSQPYPSWTISYETNWVWTAPIPRPEINFNQNCNWDESTQTWLIKTFDKATKTFI
jgi:hypothetical protein